MHTVRSSDAHTRLDQLVPNILRVGLDGLAITDHNVLAQNVPQGFLIIPGIEISSRDGHIIGLGLSEPVSRGLSADETISQIKKQGGVSIVAHPYDLHRSAVSPEKLKVKPDAIEVVNSASLFHSRTWKRAKEFTIRNNLPSTAGSDSHIPQTIGMAYTVVESEAKTIESVLDAIRRGSVSAEGSPYRINDRIRKLLWH
ncbi:MAG TPA: PHP-associated domain-containing protein [Candidatus Bathyarchaeia archaeon]|nr:PHP-associated domain-containing protein [Candidatus Bathyarchaeia archaeon]